MRHDVDELERENEHKRTYGSKIRATKKKTPGESASITFNSFTDTLLESLPIYQKSIDWNVIAAAISAATIAYELKIQYDLTRPPIIFGQLPHNSLIRHVFDDMTASPSSTLCRPIRPTFFIGTRPHLSSAMAFLRFGPRENKQRLERFREILTQSSDGAQIAVDWEVPIGRPRDDILKGKIRQPVILIWHGINNHSNFGYMRSLQRTCCTRGWNAAAVNFRGCGYDVKMTTPRGYNAAYTGDIRNTVWQISARMEDKVPIFLVGNSLGANLITKYLGEEGLAGTLPKPVAAGVSLGNPMSFRSELIQFPYNVLLGVARKMGYFDQWEALQHMTNDKSFQTAKSRGMKALTIGQLDRAASACMIRNNPFPPYGLEIGYESGEAYWNDSGCCDQIRFVSVPLLHVVAQDDFLCYDSSQRLLHYALSNPNILVVETKCGGHLGWQESRSSWWGMDSWVDEATADFIQGVLNSIHYCQPCPTATQVVLTKGARQSVPTVVRSRL